jgi:hypothetical protein
MVLQIRDFKEDYSERKKMRVQELKSVQKIE